MLPTLPTKASMPILPVLHGYTIIDEEDIPLFESKNWSINGQGYIVDTKQKPLHRQLLMPRWDLVVDHINSIRNDNRRTNLRICTVAQNTANVHTRKNLLLDAALHTSKYRFDLT